MECECHLYIGAFTKFYPLFSVPGMTESQQFILPSLFPDPLCAGPELGAGAVQRGRADPPPPGGLQRQRERGQGAPQLPSSAGSRGGLQPN